MSIDPSLLTGAATSGATDTSSTTSAQNSAAMGKDEFLQLLVTQLKNQDPLDPLKNQDFIAQLAQFNSLEQMMNLNTSFQTMLSMQQLSNASGFIGKTVSWYDPNGALQTGKVTEVNMQSGEPLLGTDTSVYVKPGDIVSITAQ